MNIKKSELQVGKWYVIEDFGAKYRVFITDVTPVPDKPQYFQAAFQVFDPFAKKYRKVYSSGYFGTERLKYVAIPRKGSKLPRIKNRL